MSCSDYGNLLDGFYDGEFDLRTSLDIEAHLRECANCRAALAERKQLSEALAASNLYFHAPPDLRHRLTQARPSRWIWPGALVPALAALLILVVPRALHDTSPEPAVLAAHLRSLEADHLIDVPSSDNHTVKPWFNGKLDFSPPVLDLKAHGFFLTGGRLDYLNGQPAAALIYKRREHVINLFIEPTTSGNEALHSDTRRGFHILSWNTNGFAYCAVSDLNVTELTQFARLLQ